MHSLFVEWLRKTMHNLCVSFGFPTVCLVGFLHAVHKHSSFTHFVPAFHPTFYTIKNRIYSLLSITFPLNPQPLYKQLRSI